MWPEGNGSILSRKFDVLTGTQIAEGNKELQILAPCAHAPGRVFPGMTSLPTIWGDFS